MQNLLADYFLTDHNFMMWTAIAAICIVPTLAHYVCLWRKREIETELKHEMIARGMSADEIERVLRAKSGPDAASTSESPGSIKVTQNWNSGNRS
jgi:hypothetical protein